MKSADVINAKQRVAALRHEAGVYGEWLVIVEANISGVNTSRGEETRTVADHLPLPNMQMICPHCKAL